MNKLWNHIINNQIYSWIPFFFFLYPFYLDKNGSDKFSMLHAVYTATQIMIGVNFIIG